jgi:TfoX/Sxy family transcriptional regulator of competence genes
MAYDEALARRIRAALRDKPGITERSMFGGIAFMLQGHMLVGIAGNDLMARVGPENHERALATKGAREMDFTGKPMRGYVFVDPKTLASAADLRRWIKLSAGFVSTLPAKPVKKAAKQKIVKKD